MAYNQMLLKDLLGDPSPENLAVMQAMLGGDYQDTGILNPQGQAPMRQAPQMPQQMPKNYLRNQDTGATYDFGPSQQSGPALDYSSAPVEIGGYGKGYRIKGDPMTVVMGDGRIVRMGEDTGAARQRQMENLKVQEAQQKLAVGGLDQQIKQAQLDEAMGLDPAARGMPQSPAYPTATTPPIFPERPNTGGTGQESGAAIQQNAMRQKFLERRFGKPPAGERWNEQGVAIPIPGHVKPLTEFQGKSSGYGSRAAAADAIISEIGNNGEVQPGLIKRSLEAVPLIGDSLGTMANFTQSPKQQQIEQAQRDFVNAVLRQESGAAISAGEFDNARKQYFPQPGDSKEVIAQKAMNRQTAISGFAASAGDEGAKTITNSKEKMLMIFDAKKAIQKGADPEKVKARLESMGITNSGI